MNTERDRGLTWSPPRERKEQGRRRRPAEPAEPAEPADPTELTELTELTEEQIRDRLRRRAIFLRELAEARELRRRVTPRRSRRAQVKAALRKNTFRAP